MCHWLSVRRLSTGRLRLQKTVATGRPARCVSACAAPLAHLLKLQTPTSGSVALQVVFRPYSIWQPPLGSNPEAKRLKLPTANPPPEYVGAALTFFVFNRGTQDIAAGWNFTYVNKNFTNITDVRLALAWLPTSSFFSH